MTAGKACAFLRILLALLGLIFTFTSGPALVLIGGAVLLVGLSNVIP